ncbi:DHA2 family efflux MFS transporter permease subunit [Acidithiobacillus sp. M4-SHS-6]|uniref:DHA2 family efflux MFS transporter permease subunit n=1 Tax=Acidithiobacillus sp. M4-SHS-6 TaxID=3383024 RepID=UPI0039BEA4D0
MSNSAQPMPWRLLAGVGLGLALGSFDGAALQAIFPYVAGGVSTSSDHAMWTLTYFVVNWAVGITIMPWTSARLGSRRAFLGACLIATVGSVISATTSNLWILLIGRAMQGIAAGLLVPLSQILFLRNTDPRRHGLITILWSNIMLIPFFLGPALGGFLAVTLSYRWIFTLSVPLWGVAAWLGAGAIPEEERQHPPAFDLLGFLLLYAGLMSLQVVLDNGEQYGWWHSRFILHIGLISLSLLLLFAWRERSAKHPLLQFHFFRHRNFWLGLLLLSLGWSFFVGWISILPLWAEETLGFNGLWASVILIPLGLAAVPLSSLMDRLRGPVGLHRLAALCFLLFALAYGTAYLSPMMGLAQLLWITFFLGLGTGSLFVPLTMVMLSPIPREELARASTTGNFLRVFSASLGVTLLSTFWIRGTALASNSLRSEWPRHHPVLPVPVLFQYLQGVASSLSIDSLLRLSMWLCLGIAVIAYFFIQPVQRPESYVEEEEDLVEDEATSLME